MYDPKTFESLKRLAKPVSYRQGHYIFHRGDETDGIYFITNGLVEISLISADGIKMIANIEANNGTIGEVSVLDGGPRTASAVCMTECEGYFIPRATFLNAIQNDLECAQAFINILCTRIRWISEELNDNTFLSVRCRVAKRLLILGNKVKTKEEWIHLSQSQLADFMNMTRESVNRTLSEFKSSGWIDLKRGAFKVFAHGVKPLKDIVEEETSEDLTV